METVQSIESGNVFPSLALKNPEKLFHAQWLTTSNRILRLYVASDKQSEFLDILTNYTSIVKVHAPFWFRVKLNPLCFEGARHLFGLIDACKLLPEKVKTIVYPVIQRNSFFAQEKHAFITISYVLF